MVRRRSPHCVPVPHPTPVSSSMAHVTPLTTQVGSAASDKWLMFGDLGAWATSYSMKIWARLISGGIPFWLGQAASVQVGGAFPLLHSSPLKTPHLAPPGVPSRGHKPLRPMLDFSLALPPSASKPWVCPPYAPGELKKNLNCISLN